MFSEKNCDVSINLYLIKNVKNELLYNFFFIDKVEKESVKFAEKLFK